MKLNFVPAYSTLQLQTGPFMVPKMPAPSLYKTRIPIYTLCGLLCRNGQVRFTHGTHPSASAERVHGDQEERGEAKGTAEQEVREANSGGETKNASERRGIWIKGSKDLNEVSPIFGDVYRAPWLTMI